MISAKDLLDSAGLSKEDQQKCFDFFVEFSRFEYALKRWGCSDKKSTYLKVNWIDVANKLVPACEEQLKSIHAKDWEIFSNPPRKQVRHESSFVWKDANTNGFSDTRRAISHLCNVRNNLFHGGKWPDEPVADPARNGKLIAEASKLIGIFVNSNDSLKHFYSEFA